MRFCYGALALVVAVVLLVGCGEGSEATAGTECPQDARTQVSEKRPQNSRAAWISLNRYIGPESVGILMAEERGYFDDVGLELTITSAGSPDGPLGYVRDEIVDFGLASQPEVVMAKEEGEPVIAVGALVPRPTAAMIWLEKSKIDGIADLKGKTIAIPGVPSQKAFLRHILEDAELTLKDVEVRRVGYKLVPALVSGRADAGFGSRNLEGAALAARGLKPVVTPVERLGIPDYEEQVVIARADRASKDPRLVRDFMAAVDRGNAAAVEDPEGAARLIEESAETDPAAGRKATEAEIEATFQLLAETGCMDPEEGSDLITWMKEERLIQRELPTSNLLTNRYVAP